MLQRTIAVLTILMLVLGFQQVQAEEWKFDTAHSTIGFSVTHLMVTKVQGTFSKYGGTVTYDPKNPKNTSLDVWVDVSSIDTNNEKRDNHLRSDDFFAAEKYPKMIFKSKRINVKGKDHIQIVGDFTMKGTTKEITLNVTDITEPFTFMETKRVAASAKAEVNRKEYGVDWNKPLDGGGVVVSNEVKINIDVQLMREI